MASANKRQVESICIFLTIGIKFTVKINKVDIKVLLSSHLMP